MGDGGMVSCHLTETNYKTTLHCAHGGGEGGRCLSLGGKIDDVGVTCKGWTHPGISPLTAAVMQTEPPPHELTRTHTHKAGCHTHTAHA